MKYKIVDFHPEDSFYEDKHLFVGKTIIDASDLHPSNESGMVAGNVVLEAPVDYYESKRFYFYAVKLEEVHETCIWIEHEDNEQGYWDTGCEASHLFFGGTPADNKFKFCPYCGKPIQEEE